MKITEIRSAVCKKAMEICKAGYNRSNAFRLAWANVKKEANSIKASDLKAGDAVRIEFGDDGNCANVVVVSASLYLGKYMTITAKVNGGRNIEFCAKLDEMFEKAVA